MILSPASTRTTRGFTLLEVVLAVLLLTLLVGMVFGTARSSLALGNTVVTTQNEEMHQQAFFELIGTRLSRLPGNARFDLKSEDSGSQYLSDLTLQNVPMTFTWGGEARTAKAVQLSTVRRRSGFLGIVLRYFEDEILPDSEGTSFSTTSLTDPTPFAEISLLEDVDYFEWQVLDGRTMEWQYDWDLQGRLPLQVELVMKIGARGEEMRHVFWIPPKQNPELIARQMMQAGGVPGGGGLIPGQPGDGGNGGNDPSAGGGGVNFPGAGRFGGGRQGGPGGGQRGPGGGGRQGGPQPPGAGGQSGPALPGVDIVIPNR